MLGEKREKQRTSYTDSEKRQRSFLEFIHHVSLQEGLLEKTKFPITKFWSAPIEGEVISFLPDESGG
jgi:hypothetical protein